MYCFGARMYGKGLLGERMLVEQIYVERILVETLPIYEDNDSGTPDSRKIKFIAALNG